MGVFGGDSNVGSFCNRDNCSLVRWVFDRLITHLLVQSIHVWLRLEGGSPGAGLESVVLLEGVGAMGVAGTVVGLEVVLEVLDILDDTFQCPLKVFWWSMLSIFTACLFVVSFLYFIC